MTLLLQLGTLGLAGRQMLQAKAEADAATASAKSFAAQQTAASRPQLRLSDTGSGSFGGTLAGAIGGDECELPDTAEELLYDTYTGYPLADEMLIEPGK